MAGVAKYSLEIKPAAAKELDALDNALFARIDRKILVLAENPRPPGSKKLRGYSEGTKTNGASAWATGVSCTSLTMPPSA
jgi:hypothetical protein